MSDITEEQFNDICDEIEEYFLAALAVFTKVDIEKLAAEVTEFTRTPLCTNNDADLFAKVIFSIRDAYGLNGKKPDIDHQIATEPFAMFGFVHELLEFLVIEVVQSKYA